MIRAIYFVFCRPKEFYRKIKRKVVKKLIQLDNKNLNKVLPWNKGVRIKTIKGVKVKFDFEFSISEKIYCFGYPNLKLTNVMEEFLGEGDTYIDIGANIGYFCALGMGHVGKSGRVYAFEPVNIYYEKLILLKKMNPDFNFIPINKALGDERKETQIMLTRDIIGESSIGMNSIVPGLRDNNYIKDYQKIEVEVFDEFFCNNETPKDIKIIKIDVEGYEFFVLKGMREFLSRTKNELLIFCEITPGAYSFLNHSLKDIFLFMKTYDFEVIDGNSYESLKKRNISSLDIVFSNSNKFRDKYNKLKYLYWNY